jgi:RNA polymerase sigma-70 factor (ECF subfamily)
MSESILACLARNEPDAMERCIAQYQGLIWSLARRFCRNRADMEDVVQSIFIDLWRSAARYDSSLGSESTFVSVIARRKLIDSRRGARRRDMGPLDEHAAVCGESPSPGFDDTEESRRARASVSHLSSDEQLVLLLVVGRGNTHSSVATVTGLPAGTVKTHVRRGLIKLRNRMSMEGDPGSFGTREQHSAASPRSRHLTRVA